MHVRHIVIKTLGVCWLSCTVNVNGRRRQRSVRKEARREQRVARSSGDAPAEAGAH